MSRLALWLHACAAISLVLLACQPSFDARSSIVDAPRIIAVRSEPAEAAPGEEVKLTMLAVDPEGTLPDAQASWGLCRSARSTTETGSVPESCVAGDADSVGLAAEASVRLPADSCAVFGPDVSSGSRPPDADATGGYQQPIRVAWNDVLAFGSVRLACRLADAPLDVARAFEQKYVRNANPTFDVEAPAGVEAGAEVVIRAAWPSASAERFPRYDRLEQRLVDARETMVVSFFATTGFFAFDRIGREASDLQLHVTNTWRAPQTPGTVHLWFVLRDDRGGVAFAAREMEVR